MRSIPSSWVTQYFFQLTSRGHTDSYAIRCMIHSGMGFVEVLEQVEWYMTCLWE